MTLAGDDAGAMRAVAMIVIGRSLVVDEVLEGHDLAAGGGIEGRVLGIDAGVDHGHGHTLAAQTVLGLGRTGAAMAGGRVHIGLHRRIELDVVDAVEVGQAQNLAAAQTQGHGRDVLIEMLDCAGASQIENRQLVGQEAAA
ncbi:MAG: hypothetical protein BWY87_01330 [Deltaproteobacteria bacterium ADurb.Bin510]|nr:MAG: hypothetical protein BWY87_01330 [Deltaproteobacteria bacterium ADurb.Bin510]